MSYEKHTWVTGEVITADKLNSIEDGIEVISLGDGIEYIGKYEGTNAEGGTIQTYGDVVTFELTGSGSTEGGGPFVMALTTFSGPSGGDLFVSSVSGLYDTNEGKFIASLSVQNTKGTAVQYLEGAFTAIYEVFKINADNETEPQ